MTPDQNHSLYQGHPEPPTETDHPDESAIESSPASRRGKKVATVIVFLLIAAVIAALAVLRPWEQQTSTTTEKPSSTVTTKSVKESGISAEKTLLGLVDEVKLDGITDVQNSLSYTTPGYAFSTSFSNTPVRGIETKRATSEAPATMLAIRDYLRSQQYAENIADNTTDTTYAFMADYTGEAAICEVSEANDYNSTNMMTITIACLDKSAFKKLATEQLPFYDAYKESQPVEANLELVGRPEIKDSQTTEYKHATIGMSSKGSLVGGALGMFYQTPDNTWHYFKQTQNTPVCADFATAELKKAYLGEQCIDASGKDLTVKL